ncbi:MAG: hypothetical protein JXB50_06450 [Spirochaetes bacterium]|nr:hypothetical protein [Spirochaetota bacterium]
MAVIVISLVAFQIITMIFAYFFIKERIEKKIVNKAIIDKIKKEINSMILQLNETTLNNINLIEDKIKNLDKKLILADRKKTGLKIETKNENNGKKEMTLFSNEIPEKKVQQFTYNPEKIVNQTIKATDIIKKEDDLINKNKIDEELKELPSNNEKVRLLIGYGWNLSDIKKKLKLSSGELELLLNIENINI